jgi:RHS repeat-associated protein
VTALLSASQMLVAKYLYDPYGNTLAKWGLMADVNSYRFSSKEWNANSGLYYYLYRFYDPNLQRWLNRDPIQESGGFNLYCAFANDGVNNFDQRGLFLGLPNPAMPIILLLNGLVSTYVSLLMNGCPSCPASGCQSCCTGLFLAGSAAIGVGAVGGLLGCSVYPPPWNGICYAATAASELGNLIKLSQAVNKCNASCPTSNAPSSPAKPANGPAIK